MNKTLIPITDDLTPEHLAQAGASYKEVRTKSTSTVEIGGFENKTTQKGIRYEWRLPQDTGMKATFKAEGLGQKVFKLFKKELQTGDESFDSAVYIDTNAHGKTSALLDNEAIRNTIYGIVISGGSIAILGQQLTYEAAGDLDKADKAEMSRFVASVINLSG